MSENSPNIYEPPVEPGDTRPTGTHSAVEMIDEAPPESEWRQVVGFLSLLGAAFFTFATAIILLIPKGDTTPDPTQPASASLPQTTLTFAATPVPTITPVEIQIDTGNTALQAADPTTLTLLLQAPVFNLNVAEAGQISREMYKPFTIVPDRPRNEVIHYTVVRGDTVGEIARRFGLEPESIAWSNPRRIVQVLRPGDVLNIPPVDGVLITAVGSTKTFTDYARLYKVDDPFVILDSPYNDLAGYTPDTVPPSGTVIFIPGGQAEELSWGIVVEGGDGGSGSGGGSSPATVSFRGGYPGSCGPQVATGGSFWSNPLNPGSYTITQGFSGYHSGIDLAGTTGLPVKAANSGRVIFAGWDTTGYGWMVALVHGPYYITVYAHLDTISVGCGQDVVAGQQVGTMGSSGNSSGTHLHFEILSRQSGGGYFASDPSYTIGF